MKYLVGLKLNSLDTVVVDGLNAGEYETNQDLTIGDIAQMQSNDVLGEVMIILETEETKSSIAEVLQSYDPELNVYSKGLDIKEDKIEKVKNLDEKILNSDFQEESIKELLSRRQKNKNLKIIAKAE